ncbi:hypothetical protein FA15DRAFT_597846 [Coprinopsis marcescibilis]|uniref:Prokaryotic-type class I peptide chain release factors domain-containing protein n=1 Tax=Coprinopsis marcescibilis TaxID=230819 RepID=A0A5C3KN73_COPMA|nr:hypothetical protein FA15DRAFT_597846 [Coprinopsis marcescibilis]
MLAFLNGKTLVACSRIPAQALFRLYSTKPLPAPPAISSVPQAGSEDSSHVVAWANSFRRLPAESLKDAPGVTLTFSRSSGPGGQNVNKVNTKVTLRCNLNSAWIPQWAKEDYAKSSHYVSSSHTLLLTSTFTRSQAQNISDSLSKLKELILSVALSRIKNPTSEATQKRVTNHIKAENARKKADKQHRSSIKQNRSVSRRWD